MKHTFFTNTHKTQQGFTLIETLIAILILAMTIGALLALTAGGFFSIRYAKNDIVASNLLQESLEYIRNTRDSEAQRSVTWEDWVRTYEAQQCDSTDGCIINPYASDSGKRVVECSGECPNLTYFEDVGFYGYAQDDMFDPGTEGYETSFVRTITMERAGTSEYPQLIVNARMQWLNGTNRKQVTQSIILTPWNLQ